MGQCLRHVAGDDNPCSNRILCCTRTSVRGGDQDEGDQSLGETRERDADRIVRALCKEAMGGVTRADTYCNITIKRVFNGNRGNRYS